MKATVSSLQPPQDPLVSPSATLHAERKPDPVIAIANLSKVYSMGQTQVHALRNISVEIQRGEYVAIVGSSGSGKSTLMNMIGLLDRPTSGSYRLQGTEVNRMGKSELASVRNRQIGFIFQRFHLLPRTSALRQVELPLFYADVPARRATDIAQQALVQVGLGDRMQHRPEELSGGQQQRVAIARALVNQPSLLLADEPTGALDTKTGQDIMKVFRQLHACGMTLIIVTHDPDVARQAERVITLSDGQIVSDNYR